MNATEMTKAYPAEIRLDRELLGRVIDTIAECAQACTACADACLSEMDVAELRTCIRTDLDCADICAATERVLSRHTGYDASITRLLLEACAMACAACADQCEQHADTHEHCRMCAEACRACERACGELIQAMGRTRSEA